MQFVRRTLTRLGVYDFVGSLALLCAVEKHAGTIVKVADNSGSCEPMANEPVNPVVASKKARWAW